MYKQNLCPCARANFCILLSGNCLTEYRLLNSTECVLFAQDDVGSLTIQTVVRTEPSYSELLMVPSDATCSGWEKLCHKSLQHWAN